MRVSVLAIAAALLAGSATAQTSPGAGAPPEASGSPAADQAAPVQEGPQLPVRVWTKDGSGLIRFELPEIMRHHTQLTGDRLTLRFDRPVRTDIVAIMKGLPDLMRGAEVSADAQTFTFRLAAPVTLRDTASAGTLLLRLTPTAPARTASTAQASGPQVRVRTGVHRGYTRYVFDWPELVDYGTAATDDRLLLRFGAPARLDLSQAGRHAKALRVETMPDGRAAVSFAVPRGGEAKHFRLGNRIVVDLYRRATTPPPAAVAESSQPPASAQAAAAPKPDVPPLPRPRPAPQAEARPAQRIVEPPSFAVRPPRQTTEPAPDPTPASPPKSPPAAAKPAPEAVQPAPATTKPAPSAPAPTPPPAVVADAPPIDPAPIDPAPMEPQPRLPAPAAAQPEPSQPVPAPQTAARPAPPAPERQPQRAAPQRAAPEKPALEKPAPEKPAPEKPAPEKPQPPERETARAEPPAAPAATPTPQAATTPTPPAEPPAKPPTPAVGAMQPVQVSRGETRLTIGFPGTADARAAAFSRAGRVWILFDRPLRFDLAPIQASASDLAPVAEALPRTDVAVVRIEAAPGFEPAVGRNESGWTVELRPRAVRPEQALRVQVEPAAPAGARVLLPVESPGPVVEMTDPEVGDRLLVVPLSAAGLGMAERRDFPEFRLLPSAQGIAVVARSERLRVTARPEAVELSTGRGLLMQGNAGDAEPVEPSAPAPATTPTRELAPAAPSLFDFAGWSRGEEPFNEVKTELQQALSDAAEGDRNAARLDLARFYFARGFAAETLGILDLVAEDAPLLAERPDFVAIRGAARVLAGHLDEAVADLADSRLDGEAEAQLWRGFAAAEAGRHGEAVPLLQAGWSVVETLPAWLRARLVPAAAEAALEAGDAARARSWLDALGPEAAEEPLRSRADYLRGRILVAEGAPQAGREAFDRAIAGPDRLARARAGLAKVELGLADGSLGHAAAIEELERLRYGWRGDDLEYAILSRLGQTYLDAGDYWSGLTVLRDALAAFPEGEHTAALTERMTVAFRALFRDGKAEELPPLKAMALYDEFRELTPPGPDGDMMLRWLAGRLVALDLFEPAANLLDELVRKRLSGEARAAAAADLALVHLLDAKPEQALAVLDLVPADDPGAQARRRHLRARALAELGRAPEAIRVLEGDTDRQADLLRADIHWRGAQWAQAAAAYRRLAEPVNPAAPLSPEDARILLRLALTLTLAGDRSGVQAVAARYGEAMAATDYAGAFGLLASGDVAGAGIDRIAATLAGVDDFQAQLKAYRAALEKPDGSS